jgi:hypothetical protein
MEVLFLICVIGAVATFVIGLFVLIDEEYIVAVFLFAGMTFFICSGIAISKNDDMLALHRMDVVTEYAMVQDVTPISIELNNENYVIKDNRVFHKFPIDFSQFKEGDIVKYSTIEGQFNKFMIFIEKAD